MKKALVVIVGVIAGLVAVPSGFTGAESDDPIACLHLHLQRRSACVYRIPTVPLQ